MINLDVITEFEYQGEKYKLQRFSNYKRARDFKKCAMPVLASLFSPVEKLISSLSLEFIMDWGIGQSIVSSERDLDVHLVICFAEIMDALDPKYRATSGTPISEINLMMRPEDVFNVVYSQILLEGLMEHFISQRKKFLDDVMKVLNLDMDNLAKTMADMAVKLNMNSAQNKIRQLADRIRLGEQLERVVENTNGQQPVEPKS